ncbi:unnamed protein product [Rangifer tarandus platyrhynchus]|uniref:Uncharacterized protein n=1 Tax=Rangifer tarandus platyrhynchus TaxID=3082113 RepID=A0AC59Z3F1_RANTA
MVARVAPAQARSAGSATGRTLRPWTSPLSPENARGRCDPFLLFFGPNRLDHSSYICAKRVSICKPDCPFESLSRNHESMLITARRLRRFFTFAEFRVPVPLLLLAPLFTLRKFRAPSLASPGFRHPPGPLHLLSPCLGKPQPRAPTPEGLKAG